jgi:hypothetical protein
VANRRLSIYIELINGMDCSLDLSKESRLVGSGNAADVSTRTRSARLADLAILRIGQKAEGITFECALGYVS